MGISVRPHTDDQRRQCRIIEIDTPYLRAKIQLTHDGELSHRGTFTFLEPDPHMHGQPDCPSCGDK